jgi:hypothetical protein
MGFLFPKKVHRPPFPHLNRIQIDHTNKMPENINREVVRMVGSGGVGE